ncbi:MAG: LamG-like jellyroll fold domain-containing protein [Methanobacteriota archaeon]
MQKNMLQIKIKKAVVCILFFILITSGVLPTVATRFSQNTLPILPVENNSCDCPSTNQENTKQRSEPFVFYDEETQRTVTRYEFDPAWIYASNENQAIYHIDLEDTYGSMVTSHLITDLGDPSSVNLNDNITFMLHGHHPSMSSIHEPYICGKKNQQDVGVVHDSIFLSSLPYDFHQLDITLNSYGCYPLMREGSYIDISTSDDDARVTAYAGDYYTGYNGMVYQDENAFGTLVQSWVFAHGYHYSFIPDPDDWTTFVTNWRRAYSSLTIFNYKGFGIPGSISEKRKADVAFVVTWQGTTDTNKVYPVGCAEWGYQVSAGVCTNYPPGEKVKSQVLDKGGSDLLFDFTFNGMETLATEIADVYLARIATQAGAGGARVLGTVGIGALLSILDFSIDMALIDERTKGHKELQFRDVSLSKNSENYIWIAASSSVKAGGAAAGYVNFMYSGEPFLDIWNDRENNHERGIWMHSAVIYFEPEELPIVNINYNDPGPYRKGSSIHFSAEVIKGDPPYTYEWYNITKDKHGDITSKTLFQTSGQTNSLDYSFNKILSPGKYLILCKLIDGNGGIDNDSYVLEVLEPPSAPSVRISDTSPNFSEIFFIDWEPVDRGYYYVVEEKHGTNNWYTHAAQGSYTFRAFIKNDSFVGDTLQYRVTAYDKLDQASSASNIVQTIISAPPLDALKLDVNRDRIGSGDVYGVVWERGDGVVYGYNLTEYQWVNLTAGDTYRLERKPIRTIHYDGPQNATYSSEWGVNICKVNMTHTVSEHTVYDYNITRIDQWGHEGSSSNFDGIVIVRAPQNTTVLLESINTVASNISYRIEFINNVSDADHYVIQEDTDPYFGSPTEKETDNTTYFSFKHTNSETGTYIYRMCAENIGGRGPWSNTIQKTVVPQGTTPGTPVLSTDKTLVYSGQPYTIQWTRVDAECIYKIKESKSETFAESQEYLLGGLHLLPPMKKTFNYTQDNSTTYYYKVKGIGVGPEGAYSNVIAVDVIGSKAPATPIIHDPGYVRAAYQAYDVGWESMDNVQFQVEESIDPSFLTNVQHFSSFSGDYTNFSQAIGKIIHTPTSSTTYYYRLRAIDGHGFSPWSSNVDMQVLVPDCTLLGMSPPVGTPIITAPINGSNILSQQQFTISWTSVPGATFYILQKGEYVGGQWIFPSDPAKPGGQEYSGPATSISLFLPQAYQNPPAAFRVIGGNYCGLARQFSGGPLNWGTPIYANLIPGSPGGGEENPGGISHFIQNDIGLFFGNNEGRTILSQKLDNSRFKELLNTNIGSMVVQNGLGDIEDSLFGLRQVMGVSIDDYDDDTHLDVGLIEDFNASVRIYDRFGGLISEYTGLAGARGLAIGTLDNDEFNDVVISEYERGLVTVHDQSRGIILQLTNLSGPLGVSIGDFNNDGDNDLVVAEYTRGSVTVYSNTGDIITRFTGLDGPEGVTIKDFSRDGYNDLAVATEDGPVIIFFGFIDHRNGTNATQTYNPFIGDTYENCLAAPLPYKSILDYCDVGYETMLTKLVEPLGSAVGDFGNDGSQDIALINPAGVRVYNRYGQILREYNVPNPRDVSIGDYNNDLLNDVAISSETGVVYIYRTNGQLIDEFYGLANPQGISIGDYDTNGQNDLAIVQTGGVTIFNQNHELLKEFMGIGNPRGVSITDNNRDGYQDVVISDDIGATYALPVHYVYSPPYQPSNPSPAHEATTVILTSDLSWTGGDPDAGETVAYDVYFGETANPSLISDHQSSTAYNLPDLAYDTTYYWQIISWDNAGLSTLGPIWSFTTKSNLAPTTPQSPTPSNDALNVSIYSHLSWSCSDPDPEDTLTYDVYWGYDPTLFTIVSQGQTTTTYNPGTLHDNTTYYWMIMAYDSYGYSTASSIWHFTTETITTGAVAGYWRFEEGSGTIAHDSSPNHNDGTITGATWTTGCQGNALYFHGGGQWYDGDCVTVPHSTSLAITSPFTVEAYIKATGSDNYLTIADKYQYISGSDSRGFTLYLTNGRLRFSLYSGSHGNQDVMGTTDLRDNICHHVIGTWDGSAIKIYVDGQPQGQTPWSYAPAATTQNLGIGKRLSGWGGYLPFLGVIDEVKITTSLPLLTIQGHCYYPGMQPVNNLTVEIRNLNTTETWQAETETNYYSTAIINSVDVHQGEILRFIARDENESVNITDHIVTSSDISTGSITLDPILTVHYRDLKSFPFYVSQVDTGATVAQMMLNYLMWNNTQYSEPPLTYPDQHELFISLNIHGGTYLDGDELCSGLNRLIDDRNQTPPWQYGYFFAPYHNASPTPALKHICYWLDYPVNYYNYLRDVDVPKLGHPNHVPVAIPLYGAYNNWAVIRGIHTDQNAWLPPEQLNVYGFWLNDPKPNGVGSNTYVTVQRFLDVYYKPITILNDTYNGTYLAITDPPRDIASPVADTAVNFVESPVKFSANEARLVNRLVKGKLTNIITDNIVIRAAYEAASDVLKNDPVYADLFTSAQPTARPRYEKATCLVNFAHQGTTFKILINTLDGSLLEIQISTQQVSVQ